MNLNMITLVMGALVYAAPQTVTAAPNCTQSMLTGRWHLELNESSIRPTLNGACRISVTSAGIVSTLSCTTAYDRFKLLTRPSGTLTINAYCEVSGSIEWSVCQRSECDIKTDRHTLKPELWRSGD